jgi:hypothetical protein
MPNNYYGPKMVVAREEKDNDVILTLDDESKVKVNKLLIKNALTDKGVDYTTLRINRMKVVAEEVLKVLLKYDIQPFAPLGELNYVLDTAKMSFFDNYKKAIEKKFGVKEEETRLSDVDKILKDEV